MAASRSSRVTRSSVGLNGLDENFCGRTLRNRSIAQPEDTSASPLPRARSPKKKQESKQEAKEKPKPEQKEEAKQDAKQEHKPDVKQDAKEESKRGADEDAKGDCLQDGQRQALLQAKGKAADSNASSAEAEQWSSSKKRDASSIGNDFCPEKSENCDGGAGSPDSGPPTKRAKRCSRSGDSQGQGDDPELSKPDGEAAAAAAAAAALPPGRDNNCEEWPRQNSVKVSPASPVACTQAAELTVEMAAAAAAAAAEDGPVECDGPIRVPNAHGASNGLKETQTEDAGTPSEEHRTSCATAAARPLLLNGSQTAAPPSPVPAVPCRSSASPQVDACGQVEPEEEPVPELMVAKEQEVQRLEEVEEVDVVGEAPCLAHEEQVAEAENDRSGRPSTPAEDVVVTAALAHGNSSPINSSNSGETTPPLVKSPSPTEPAGTLSMSSTSPPSFSELYEHRYTLRTSPRRAANGTKASHCRPGSPPRDNGPVREEGEVVAGVLEEQCPAPDEAAAVSDPVGSSSYSPEEEEEPMLSIGPEVQPGDEEEEVVEEEMEGVEEEAAEAEEEVAKDMEVAERSKEPTLSQAAEEEEEEEEPDVYYFESDHLALKHNKDYQRLLQTIGVLEAQRTQAILDLEALARHQREALSNPIEFVEQLQKQVNLGLPCPQRVVQLPDIAWEQYTSGLGDFEREFCDKKRKTRRLKLIFDKGLPDRPKSPVEVKKEGETSTMYSSLPTSDAPEHGRQMQMIRGRICHPNKSDTFNQLWTVEEQKKLEQLLVKFPPEEVESRRWQKIADELGNRTAKQVASRVQKYFIKLTKAGIPVPGRTPNLCMYTKKASSKRQHHLNKHLYRPSTFLTSYEPPVFMDEDDEHAAYFGSVQDPSADDSDEETIPVELRNLPEYKQLLELKRLKKQTLREIQDDKEGVRHAGYKCDLCGVEPIQGVRWHCRDCPPDNSVDFCSCCSNILFKTETHKPHHHLEPVHQPETFLDRDYCLPQSTGYNYLDPNYFPANR